MASLYHITYKIIKKFQENYDLRTSSEPFWVCKESSTQTLLENETWKWKQTTYIRYVFAKLSKFVKHADFLRFLFTEDSFKIEKDLELVSRRYFPCNFLIKFFFRSFTWTSQISSPDWVYFPSYLAKCVSCFMLKHLMTSWHLNIWKVKS